MAGATEWLDVPALVRVGLGTADVVLVNEAHHGALRSVRTRRVGLTAVEVAHDLGVRDLALEALPARATVSRTAGRLPSTTYVLQPEMQALLTAALQRGWRLHGYDVAPESGTQPSRLDVANAREAGQAQNLAALACDAQPLLVWCGNGHLLDVELDGWRPMGARLRHDLGVATFSIDQTCTVRWPHHGWDYDPRRHADVLNGSEACGFLAACAPAAFPARGADAYVLSLDNDLT